MRGILPIIRGRLKRKRVSAIEGLDPQEEAHLQILRQRRAAAEKQKEGQSDDRSA